MMRSLYSGISGLRNHQTRMDVIGNNISNVNTAGYKTSRVIFQEIFSQNVSSGQANQGDMGGTNPVQIGLGIRLSTVDVMHSRSAFQRTDNPTDLTITGDGFFIVAQINPDTGNFENLYTRAGNFGIDNDGYLVSSHGYYVLGYNVELVMGVVDPGQEARDPVPAITQVRIGTTPTTQFEITDDDDGSPLYITIPAGRLFAGSPELKLEDGAVFGPGDLFDNSAAITIDFGTAGEGDMWPATALTLRVPVAAVPGIQYRPPTFGLVPGDPIIGDNNGLSFTRVIANQLILPRDPISGLPVGYPLRPTDATTDEEYSLLLEQWLAAQPREFEEVSLPGFAVNDSGDISVILGNRSVVIGRLALAMFANPGGLEKAGNSLYREASSSGPAVVTEALQDGAGKIDAGGLEMSNVDLANEFTDMIVTQRGFQANSRIIGVSDSMLEELVNLKR